MSRRSGRSEQLRLRRLLLLQRAVLTVVVAGAVLLLPLGPNRFALAAVIVVVQLVATWLIPRRRPAPTDELGAFMVVEQLLTVVATMLCPAAYVAANMMAIASVAVNAPYLDVRWVRRIAPITVSTAVLAPIFHDVISAPPIIVISVVLSLHLSMNRTGAVLVAQNAIERAQWQANHDELTGLANRRVLVERLDEIGEDHEIGLLLMDLDEFKTINDTLGHHVGDIVLRTLATRFSEIDDSVLVVRLGGDEFAFLVRGPAERTALIGAALVEALSTPIALSDGSVPTGASIGMVHSSNAEPHELLRFADIAMFNAKRTGGGCSWYDREGVQYGTRKRDVPSPDPSDVTPTVTTL